MGLDMYLTAKKYISGGWKHATDEQKKIYKSVLRAVGIPASLVTDESPSLQVEYTVAYWRKANSIHSWFVRNVQDGKDDCKTYYVAKEQLRELLNDCNEVLKTRNSSILQPKGGFFFGSTRIDEGYWFDIEDTVKKLTRILEAPALQGEDLYYQSSW